MAKPSKGTPHSDIDGVDRDARPGLTWPHPEPDPGRQLRRAQEQSAARPNSKGGSPARPVVEKD